VISSRCGCCNPPWPGARPADTVRACRICIRSPCRGAPRHWTDHTSRPKWLACTEGCGDELELRVIQPTWPGAWPADTVPACRICIGSPVAEHLDTGQTTPQASRWWACTGGCGYELELRVLHPTWPGARPPAPTRCPRAAYASGRPVAEHLDTGQTTPQASRWLPCTEGCGDELELRVAAPPVAWRAASRHGARVPHMHQVTQSRSTSTLDRPHLKPRGGCLAQRAVARSSSCGCCTPRGLARGQPTRCPCAAYASGRPCRGAPRHWTDHTSSLEVGWLAQGAAALSSSCGFCAPVAWRATSTFFVFFSKNS